jgi:two-component system, NarL family, sensor histidine kinase EvgS
MSTHRFDTARWRAWAQRLQRALVVGLALGLPVAAPAQTPGAPLKVGLLAESSPFHVWPDQGSPQGYDLDLLNHVAARTGLKFEYVRFERWNDLQDALASDRVDLVTATAMTPQRAQWMRFTRMYASVQQGFAGSRNITSVSAGPDLAGRRIGVGRAFATEAIAAERFPLAVRIAYDSEKEALAAVVRGDVDLVFGGAAGLRAQIAAMAQAGDGSGSGLAILRTFGFPEGQRRIGAKFARTELIGTIDAALASIDRAQQRQWHERWIAAWEQPARAAALPVAGVAPLRVGYFGNSPPWTFVDRDGAAQGVGIRLARAAFERAGVPIASFAPVSLAEGLDAVRQQRLDVMMGVTETAERSAYMQFVGPYRANPVVIVSRDHAQIGSLDQLVGRRLMVRKAFFALPYLQHNHPSIELGECDPIDRCMDEVENGNADAVLMSMQSVIERLGVGKRRGLIVSGMVSPLHDEENFGLRKGLEHLAPGLRDALEAAVRQDLPRIEREWMAEQARSRVDWTEVRKAVGWTALVLLALGAAAFWHQRRLKAEIERTQRARAQSEQYLAFMAHEVRNSLQSVAGSMVLLRRSDPAGSRQTHLLDALSNSARATLGLLNDLLDRHRLHAGGMALALRPESIDRLLAAVIDEVRPAAEAKQLDLKFEAQGALHGWWLIDGLRLQQILRNLLVNAVKFSAEGAITVSAGLTPSERGASWRRLSVSVSDEGPGLAPDVKETLFAGMVSKGGDRPGSGLGLMLSRDLAHAMGGELTVQSPVHAQRLALGGGGARFTVSLDVEPAPVASASLVAGAAQGVQRVLVVEDSPVYGLLLTEGFAQTGVAVHLADSLAKAREALIASVAGAGTTLPAFDLVVSDTNLPDGHVRELLAFVREAVRPGVSMPPVICISADVSTDDAQALTAAGAVDVHSKDSDVGAFVRRLLAARAAQASASAAAAASGPPPTP